MLFHEMLHVIILIQYFLYIEVMHKMKDYNYLHITTSSQLLRLNLDHNVSSGNAPCHNFNSLLLIPRPIPQHSLWV